MDNEPGPSQDSREDRCAECGTLLTEGQDRQETDEAVFCRPCFEKLGAQVEQAIQAQSQDINYPMATVGALLGAAVGILAWWGFTVLTEITFGLVAIVIGFAVGKGVTILSGDKRSQGLQILSVVVSGLAFFYASYLVNRTFLLQAFAEEGQELVMDLPLMPDPGLFYNVISLNFGMFDIVFLAIVVYQAWKLPAPLRLAE